jgi:hypothetical protein
MLCDVLAGAMVIADALRSVGWYGCEPKVADSTAPTVGVVAFSQVVPNMSDASMFVLLPALTIDAELIGEKNGYAPHPCMYDICISNGLYALLTLPVPVLQFVLSVWQLKKL